MIYQANILVTLLLLILSTVFLCKYVAMHSDLFFGASCDHEESCKERYFKGAVLYRDEEFLQLLRDEYLEPPPEDFDQTEFNIYEPVWNKLVNWESMQEKLKEVWEDRPPGFFVEVGAVDGVFMSQTLALEKNFGWTGLLVEPDPRSYELLKAAKRNAWLSSMCVNVDAAVKRSFWIRTMDEDLPFHFQQILLARSKLSDETMVGDEDRGEIIWKLCAPLSSLLLAGNFNSIDMLSTCTGSQEEETRISDVLNKKNFDVKTLLVQYPASRYFSEKYSTIKGYLLDMAHSELLVKFYVKKSLCQLVQRGKCKPMHYYDTVEACVEYFCMGFLTVWTSDDFIPKPFADYSIPKDLKPMFGNVLDDSALNNTDSLVVHKQE